MSNFFKNIDNKRKGEYNTNTFEGVIPRFVRKVNIMAFF